MARKFFEIIMVPSTSAQFIRYRVSYRSLVWAGIFFVLLLLLIAMLMVRHVNIERQKATIAESKHATYALKAENEWLREETQRMEEKIEGFQSTVDQFKKIFGVKSEGQAVNPEAGPGMSITETRESELYNAFLYMAKLRGEPERIMPIQPGVPSGAASLGVILTATPSAKPVRRGFASSGFGYRIDPFTGESVYHSAVDLSAWYWEEVIAPADGLVVRTGYNAGDGRFVEISHGYGYSTRYAHLQKYTVLPGDRVRRYDVIGYVGNTGRSTGPHLHYEIRFAGIPLDPIPFISNSY